MKIFDKLFNFTGDVMNHICYIISACCKSECSAISKLPGDIIIAADKGYEISVKYGIDPDIVLGDFDSLKYIPKHRNTVVHPVKKDATDTFLAVEEGMRLGFKKFVILGGIGGKRVDHTVANMQTLVYIAKKGGRGVLTGAGAVMTAVHCSKVMLPKKNSGFISIFCMGDRAHNVKIHSLKYELNNADLVNSNPLGVSNEFIGKTDAFASVEDGDLLIMWRDKAENILSKAEYSALFQL